MDKVQSPWWGKTQGSPYVYLQQVSEYWPGVVGGDKPEPEKVPLGWLTVRARRKKTRR